MKRPRWSDAELDLLRRTFANTLTGEIAQTLGRGYSSVANKAAKLGLKKSAEFMAKPESGRLQDGGLGVATRFQPGLTPWNKGTHFVAGGRSALTRFKSGRPAHEASNYRPIGSTRINRDGYLEQKVTDDPDIFPARRWVGVHRLVWEAANGPVPEGMVVVFKNGQRTTDAQAITADRLECITRVELMRRNTIHKLPRELVQVTQLRGAINRQINRRAKEAASHEPEH